MRAPTILLPVIATALLSGCGGAPPTTAPQAVNAAFDPAAEARLAMAAGDWQAAADHLRVAIRRTPGSLDLHYRLAVCASHLEQRDEAIREFEWVQARAKSGSDEARVARAWLAETQSVKAARVAALVPTARDAQRGNSTLAGTATWLETGGIVQPRPRHLLMLDGLEGTATKGLRYRVRTSREGRYAFKDVVPGAYRLTDATAEQPSWRLRVVLESGRETILDLSADNSAGVRDDFPEKATRPASTAAGAPSTRTARPSGADGAGGPASSPHSTEGN